MTAKQRINNSFLQFAVTHLHPSFLMAILMGLVFVAIEANESSAFILWTVDKTGIHVAVMEGALIVCGFAIVYFKPGPLTTISFSAPVVFLGGYLIWYGLGTDAIPGVVILYLGWGYVATTSMLILAYVLMQLATENLALRKAAEAPPASPPVVPVQQVVAEAP